MPAHRLVSARQLDKLLTYMEENRSFAVGRQNNNGPSEKLRVNCQWQELANMLNSVGEGTTKTATKWREYWNEKKYAARKKASTLRQHARGTGGGPPKKGSLTDEEERVLSILGKVAVQGNQDVRIPLYDTPQINEPGQENDVPQAGTSRALSDSYDIEPEPEPEPAVELASMSTPWANTPVTRPSDSAATPSRGRTSYRNSTEVPQWALQMEERRHAMEERQMRGIEAIRDSVAAIQRTIEAHIEVIMRNNLQE